MASGHTLFTGVPEQMPNAAGHARQTISPSPDAFGALTAKAGMELGGAIDKATGTLLESETARNTLQNEIHASETNTWLANQVTERFEKFSQLRGKQALDGLPAFKTEIEGLYQENIKAGGNLQTEAALSRTGRALTTRYFQYGTFHANREFKTWGDETAQRRAATFGAQAGVAEQNGDMAGMQTALHTSDDEVRKLAEQRGLDAEATSALVMKNRGQNLKTIIELRGNDDPVAAAKLFEAQKAGMDPASQLHVKNFLRSKLTGVVAKGKVDELLGPETGASPARKFESVLVGRESSHQPGKVNQLGYAGLYQFGAPRAAAIGVYTPGPGEDLNTWSKTPGTTPGKWSGTFNIPGHPEVKSLPQFLASPGAQRAAYGLHQQTMDREIETNKIDRFIGQSVGGVPITREGLYAMMHLGGAGGAKRALESGGKDAVTDANGTSVMDYARLGAAAAASPYAGMPPKAVAYEAAITGAGGNVALEQAMITEVNRRYARADGIMASSRVQFDRRMQDTLAESSATGGAVNPLSLTDFVSRYGLEEGQERYRGYNSEIEAASDNKALQEMSSREQQATLERMVPAPGVPGYAASLKRYGAAEKAVEAITKKRTEDPAGSVSADVNVRAAAAAVDSGKPETVQMLAAARLVAQEGIGIPEESRSPISKAEALALMVPLQRALPGQEREALQTVAQRFQQLYGPYAEDAFQYALRAQKLDAEVTKMAARVLKKLALGEEPTGAENVAADRAGDISAADRAVTTTGRLSIDRALSAPSMERGTTSLRERYMSADMPAANLNASRNEPNDDYARSIPANAIKALRADPKLKADFDRKYGAGASKKILDAYPVR